MQGTPQNTKSWPCWGREGSWGWYLWVCHCSHGLSDLLRRVETGKTKITRKGRSSFSYQPKASPALVPAAAKGRMKLHPVWGLLHMTVPREHWDSGGFRYRQKILLGLSCTQHRQCLALQTGLHRLLFNEHCRELELPLGHKQHHPGWKSWIHGMVWGPALIAHLPRGALQSSLHSEHSTGLGSARASGATQGMGALKNHHLGFCRLIGVNCLGRLKNSTANGKCGC